MYSHLMSEDVLIDDISPCIWWVFPIEVLLSQGLAALQIRYTAPNPSFIDSRLIQPEVSSLMACLCIHLDHFLKFLFVSQWIFNQCAWSLQYWLWAPHWCSNRGITICTPYPSPAANIILIGSCKLRGTFSQTLQKFMVLFHLDQHGPPTIQDKHFRWYILTQKQSWLNNISYIVRLSSPSLKFFPSSSSSVRIIDVSMVVSLNVANFSA